MKAYTIQRYSKTDKLQQVELPEPLLGDGEVLVQIHAASINQLDVKLKYGEFKLILPYKLPLVLGHDLAGTVQKVGTKVSGFKPGDQVFARRTDFSIGTFATHLVIKEGDLALKPSNISMEEAASIPLVGLTVWQALVDKAQLQKGQKVFIQAGSGGVGTIAIQIAKHLGAYVATTTSKDNFELVKKLGADVVIDYKSQDFESVLHDYDVVLHSQDEQTLLKSMRILKSGGKIISISGPADLAFAKKIGLSWLMQAAISFLSRKAVKAAKKLGVDYSFLFMQANGEQLAEISKLIEAGKIEPVVDRVFAFEQINEAMNYVALGRAKGKVVVKMLHD